MSTLTPPPDGLEGLEREYRSGSHRLDAEFFQPCLTRCGSYDRAVGYFTSHALAEWARTVPAMLRESHTRIRLIVGPVLLPEDKKILNELATEEARMRHRQQVADIMLDDAFANLQAGSDNGRLELFSWLVANERLQIRFAFPVHVPDPDLYHEKFGIFRFRGGARVAFTGSANETIGGYRQNFEYVDVYRSWIEGDVARVESKANKFDDTWKGLAPGLIIRTPSTDILARIKNLPSSKESPPHDSQNRWIHQDRAIAAFISARHGILEMATGTGKTRTALRIAERLLAERKVQGVIVSTSGNDLLDQWSREIREYNSLRHLILYKHYRNSHDIARYTMHPKQSILLCSRDALPRLRQALSDREKEDLLIIHDEVHGFGSPVMCRELAGFHASFAYVLGLSATPEREYDAEGNDFIEKEIGPIIFRFGLDEAIRKEILCPFRYTIVGYELTDDDRRRLRQVFARQKAAAENGRPWSDEQLFRELSLVYKTAEEKPARFNEFIRENPGVLRSSIIFVETKDYAERFLDAVGFATTSYSTYFDDDPQDRLKELSSGEIDCLIACKRLSEGIDVRHLRNVILVSSNRGRLQTIQRIGRTLRLDPTDPDKIANVVDFVWTEAPPDHADVGRREWLEEISSVRPER